MNEIVPEPVGPVPSEERIAVIDCLRGAALFGILMANMRGFHAPMDAYMRLDYWAWMPDRITQAIVDILISGKFITIFATLFGIGFAIQMDRAALRTGGVSFYRRRMAALFLIGLAHSMLLWWGDILTNYAICGYFLLLFRNASQRALFWSGQALYWFIVGLFFVVYISITFGGAPLPPEPSQEAIQATIRAYSTGTIQEVFVARAREWTTANAFVLFLTRVLGLFLMGTFIWRAGYLREPSAHLGMWRKARNLGLIFGLMGNAFAVFLEWYFNASPTRPSLQALTWVVVQSAAIPALSLGYAATLVIWWQDPVWQRRLQPFSYVGRMALTNYLMQSLICTTIFYSYGFGLYNRVGPVVDVPLAIVIYGLQVPFSKWWLSSHRYGPVEWLWRRMTYGSLAPPRITTAS